MKFGGHTLHEALLQALFTDGVSPEGAGGFWGNGLIQGEFQSTLWRFYPSAATSQNIEGARREIEEALNPFILQGVAHSITVKYEGNAFLITIQKDDTIETLRIPWQS